MIPMEIDGNLMKLIITNGSIKLKNNHQEINDLNVFPVPDGDTGSNMQSTMMSGVEAIKPLDDDSVESVGKALARGLLMGARGNSGVILSQLFSGFGKAFQTLKTANAKQFVEGLNQGVKQAYGAVINPLEGTILTVAREGVEKAQEVATEDSDVLDVLKTYLDAAKISLENTPELLPVLKESGVVDSGGAGLIEVIEGMVAALEGEIYQEDRSAKKAAAKAAKGHEVDHDEEFGYCTEFIVQFNENRKKFNKDKLIKQLSRLGDSIVVVADDEILKVHIHTLKPGDALNLGQEYGEFANMKIENMTLQHTETLLHQPEGDSEHLCGHDHSTSYKPSKPKKYGIITVLNGEGIKESFREMGVDYIIDGGQTMNPSTQDFVDAIEAVNADNILIVPNNKNVMLSAEHAKNAVEGKNVIVIPAKTIPQGYASLTMFDANQDLEDTVEEMKELISHVKTGEITYAIRDTEMNGVEISKNDYLGIKEGDIVVAEKNRLNTAKALVESLIDEDSEIITIIAGSDIDEKEIKKLEKHINNTFEELEIETIVGGQAVYHYLFAVE